MSALLAVALTGARASDILVINGAGTSSVAAPLSAAGFNVIGDSFRPGAIADHLNNPNDISEIWVWNDGTFGNTGSPAVPALAFSAADEAALTLFNATHSNWIMDGLSWRGNANPDEKGFTANEALNMSSRGGGIVLGADDASGAAIVQHVNQVAALFNFTQFDGVYVTLPGTQQTGGSFFTTPNSVNPTNIVGTTTYSEIPHGLQPNGITLGTAVFGLGDPDPGFGSPALGSDVFGGITYQGVNHLVTTNIPGATIPGVPEPSSLVFMLSGAAAFLGRRRTRRS